MSNTIPDCTQKTKPELTAESVRELFIYEPETGKLRWKVSKQGLEAGTVAGGKRRDGYVRVQVGGRRLYAHRVIWAHLYGAWPSGQIDHINGDTSDNRAGNLRDVSPQVNQQNRLRASHGAIPNPSDTGLLGSCFDRRRQLFIAAIKDPVTRKNKYLGRFDTPEEAHAAYLAAKRQMHPGCTI